MAEPLSQASIPVHSFQRGHCLDFQHWLAIRALLRDWQPDVIHVFGIDALRTLSFASLLRRSALPPVVLSLPPSWLRSRRLSWYARRLVRRASRLIASCESDRVAIAAAGLPANKARVIRPGVSRTKARVELDLPPGPILMTAGHMREFGRLMDAIWVAEILSYVAPDLQTVVVGEGDFKRRLLDYFHDMPRITSRVHFLGARNDAASLLGLADVVLVPHRRLGGTFTTLEAMAAGRAVVATRLPHIEAIIRDGETGMLATPADQPGIARPCLRLLENSTLRETIGNAAREAVGRDFSLDAMIADFATTYEEASVR